MTATQGFSGADLTKVSRDAKRSARRAKRALTINDVIEALPELVPITGKLRRALAIHEAGHTMALTVLKHGRFHGAMIIASTRNDGQTALGGGAYYELPSVAYRTAQTYRNQIAVLLAGMAAEEIIMGAMSDGAGAGEQSDLAQATRIATLLQTHMGLGNRLRHSLATRDADLEQLRQVDGTVTSWVDGVLHVEFTRAKQLVRDNRDLVERIADALDANGSVTAEQLAQMVSNPNISKTIDSAA